jgi:hypothetical protein
MKLAPSFWDEVIWVISDLRVNEIAQSLPGEKPIIALGFIADIGAGLKGVILQERETYGVRIRIERSASLLDLYVRLHVTAAMRI